MRIGPVISFNSNEQVAMDAVLGILYSLLAVGGVLYILFKLVLTYARNNVSIVQGIGVTCNLFWCLIDCT
jgi:hypothetical protein